MPHGMFSRSLAEEAVLQDCKQRIASATVASSDGNMAVQSDALSPLVSGTQVIIDGLLKCPAFNGLRVVVDSFDEGTSRYNVLFDTPVAGHTSAKVKRENLLPVCLPPLQLDRHL
jgi:hypothetical protein